jgi:mono/diheme cytochrome c family protein
MIKSIYAGLFSIALIFCLTIGCASSSSNLNNDDVKKLYKQNCALCHGLKGKLGLNGAKDFALSKLTIKEKVEIITNGKDKMLPFKNSLTEEQIKALAEYTSSFKK